MKLQNSENVWRILAESLNAERCKSVLFMVFQLDSEGAQLCKSCRSRQELSSEYLLFSIYLQNLASIQPRRERASQSLPKISQKLEQKLEQT